MDTLLGEAGHDDKEGSLFGDQLTARSDADKENLLGFDLDNRTDTHLDLWQGVTAEGWGANMSIFCTKLQ